ncbi:hypothetical protein [Sphingomonas beigongshangi]|uniref:hypothetical protein n=1 Tax=Sphingomonas beigongshangi TaxID=2782540 RepID=UPI00193B1D87|nr:hypothetical protein [Sphingomonas beigongshangi]
MKEMAHTLNALANRFVATPLPEGVAADLCATRADYPHQRYGTNLLTVDQAAQMLGEILGDLLDEDRLAEIIDDSLDMDWTGRVGARAILRAITLPTQETKTKEDGE